MSCEYATLDLLPNDVILVADSHCSERAPYCLLTTNCTHMPLDFQLIRNYITGGFEKIPYNIRALGNMSLFAEATLSIPCNDQPLDVSKVVLPKRLNSNSSVDNRASMYCLMLQIVLMVLRSSLNRCQISSFPPSMQWPKNLQYLSLENNCLKAIVPFIPSSLQVLKLAGNQISDVSSLAWTQLQQLDLQRNKLIKLEHLNWASLSFLELSYNPNLNTIDNVTLSNALYYFGCASNSLKHVFLDIFTYSALSRLTLNENLGADVKNCAFVSNISINKDECSAFGTNRLPVWPNYHNVTWDVCVNVSSRMAMQPEQTNKSTNPPKAPASTMTAAIAVSFVALIAIALYALYRRRVHRLRQQWDATDELMDDLEVLSPIRIPMNDVTLISKINEGAFGEIHRGQYLGRAVAVKKLLPQKTAILDIQGFINELQIMSRFDCARIVALYGVAWTRPRDITAVIELMDLGDLKEFLSVHRLVPWTKKLQIIRDIVEALIYIHSMNIIHRDMKSRNVLLDSAKGAKITDFGVSKEDFQETMTISVGTYRWMAPEILKDDHYTIAADIFSLGMIMSEIDTHEIPYAQTVNPKTGRAYVDTAIVSMVINGTIQPTFTPTCPPWLKSLALQCLSHDPEDRPTAIEVDFALSNIAIPDDDVL